MPSKNINAKGFVKGQIVIPVIVSILGLSAVSIGDQQSVPAWKAVRTYRTPYKATITRQPKNHQGEIVKQTNKIVVSDGYSLDIETRYIYDSSISLDKLLFDQNEVVFEQKLRFRHLDTTLATFDHQVKSKVIKTSVGKNKILDNVIREVGVIYGSKGTAYKVMGAGGCNACSEFIGYYTLRGQLLSMTYSSKMGKFSFSKGTFENTLTQLGVLDSLRQRRTLKGTSIFPPRYSATYTQMNYN